MKKNKDKEVLNSENKIGFFKKFYYSIFRTDKYNNLIQLGAKKSKQYLIDLLFVLSIIYSIIYIFQMKNVVRYLKTYLQENIPELVYENNILTTETERTILNDKIFVQNFGGQVIIDTKSDYEKLKNEYINKNETTILLTKNYYTTIEKDGKTNEYSYGDILKTYFKKEIIKLDKTDLLYLCDNVNYTFHFVARILSFLIAYSILAFGFALIIALITYLFCKLKKYSIPFSKIYTDAIYSSTFFVIGMSIANFLPLIFNIIIKILYTVLSIGIFIKTFRKIYY